MQHGDTYIILLLIAIAFVWGWYRFRDRLSPANWDVPIIGELVSPLSPEVSDLLEYSGYEIVAGKHRISIQMDMEGELFESRLFIDGYARLEEELFIIRAARERKPLEWTGASLRENLLVYHLLAPNAAGILYVDVQSQTIKQIRFEIEK